MNSPIPRDLALPRHEVPYLGPDDTTAKHMRTMASRLRGARGERLMGSNCSETAARILDSYADALEAPDRREADAETIAAAIERFHWLGEGSYDEMLAEHIAAALGDAHHGGHWERYDGPTEDGGRYRQEWQQDKGTARLASRERWVPATPPDPDAALIQAVRAYYNDADIGSSDDGIRDLIARLREVAEVTAR